MQHSAEDEALKSHFSRLEASGHIGWEEDIEDLLRYAAAAVGVEFGA